MRQTQYLVVRDIHAPAKVTAHLELHSIVPSGEPLTEEQRIFLYDGHHNMIPPPMPRPGRPANSPHCRYITQTKQLFVDDGGAFIFEVTDQPPKGKKTKPQLEAAEHRLVTFGEVATTVPRWMLDAEMTTTTSPSF